MDKDMMSMLEELGKQIQIAHDALTWAAKEVKERDQTIVELKEKLRLAVVELNHIRSSCGKYSCFCGSVEETLAVIAAEQQ